MDAHLASRAAGARIPTSERSICSRLPPARREALTLLIDHHAGDGVPLARERELVAGVLREELEVRERQQLAGTSARAGHDQPGAVHLHLEVDVPIAEHHLVLARERDVR